MGGGCRRRERGRPRPRARSEPGAAHAAQNVFQAKTDAQPAAQQGHGVGHDRRHRRGGHRGGRVRLVLGEIAHAAAGDLFDAAPAAHQLVGAARADRPARRGAVQSHGAAASRPAAARRARSRPCRPCPRRRRSPRPRPPSPRPGSATIRFRACCANPPGLAAQPAPPPRALGRHAAPGAGRCHRGLRSAQARQPARPRARATTAALTAGPHQHRRAPGARHGRGALRQPRRGRGRIPPRRSTSTRATSIALAGLAALTEYSRPEALEGAAARRPHALPRQRRAALHARQPLRAAVALDRGAGSRTTRPTASTRATAT